MTNLRDKIFNINNESTFEQVALEVFRYQAVNNPIYKEYISYLRRDINEIDSLQEIPFLPIELFKTHTVITGSDQPIAQTFTSSGTTGMATSKHHVTDISIYEESFMKGFEHFYGDIKDYCVLALLPSYLEREGSSLIYMMERLITASNHADSGFYLHNQEELVQKLKVLESQNQKVLLIGVTFALLDLADNYQLTLSNTIVMETGGMKGRKEELTKEQLHIYLKEKLGVDAIHSEYGMTELLSQAYSKGNNLFYTPVWMKVLIRDTYDPFSYLSAGKSGGINVIDLANLNSCSFIETKDLGRLNNNGSFEVLGRFDNSDIRGCNLLVL